jgi:signal peptidase I
MSERSRRRRVGPLRLAIGSVILLVLFGIWGLFLTGELSVQKVGSGSMEPTFMEGDVLLMRRYHGGELKRGDLVIIESPDDEWAPLLKRIVAIPGDHVDNLTGVFMVNGRPSPPPNLNIETSGWAEDIIDLELDFHEFYVMGDNRPRSYDSRDFGPINRSLILGIPIWRTGPAGRRGPI